MGDSIISYGSKSKYKPIWLPYVEKLKGIIELLYNYV